MKRFAGARSGQIEARTGDVDDGRNDPAVEGLKARGDVTMIKSANAKLPKDFAAYVGSDDGKKLLASVEQAFEEAGCTSLVELMKGDSDDASHLDVVRINLETALIEHIAFIAGFERATTAPTPVIIDPEPDFVTMTKADEAHIRGAA
ncbi:MAG: hypothetical protein E5X59_04235 [Mesorhizobium sp.]|nr:MAG: hypothetical protein E5X60_01575 [Mesorhizobium sp.]TIQ85740.1 MAG: hypothetical protein E5X44_26390 [Mesorhizobium sp.]TJW56871.1 MAG: hypothetical protein E5X59_04235 [Mesorhizobium sp.]